MSTIPGLNEFLVRLHGEYNTSLALWKHHVNLLLQSFPSVSSDLRQCYLSAN